ncbi:MAG TPA: hypothetical protein VIJ62_08990, partial [Rhizomicrobium sp.]
MKKLTKIALGAALAAGTALAASAPANAGVSVGIGIGFPGYYGGGPYYRYCDYYSPWYDPYACGGGYGGGAYFYDPIFFGGAWYHGPFRWRYWGGHRWFWAGGHWHQNEWHGAMPGHITFHNGGTWDGHLHGFGDGHGWNGHGSWGGHDGHGSWNGDHSGS